MTLSFCLPMIPHELLKKTLQIELHTSGIVTGLMERGWVQNASRSASAVRAGQPIPRIINA
jgi:hypothetical protein